MNTIKIIMLGICTSVLIALGTTAAALQLPLPSLAPMLETVTPAVVNISTRGPMRQANPLMDDPFFQRFFGMPDQQNEPGPQSLGSGVVIDAEEGLIVTNSHVIANASEISITLSDGRELNAELVGSDPQADIAVVRVQAEGLTQIQWSDSDALRVGDFCVAIGNPFGLGQTVTSGIVSALGRSGLGIEDFEDFIQTDASINPGNSGGALVNLNGELIGINTAIVGPSGGNVGIGFAIPSNMARGLIEQLVEHGTVRRGALGISAQELTPRLAAAFGVENKHGVVIRVIRDGSPADKAGLAVGDIITAVDGRPVRDIAAVKNRIGLVRLGQRLRLSVVRNGKPQELEAVVEQLQYINPLLDGVEFAESKTSTGRPYVAIDSIERGSVVESYGLKPGDIILSVNQEVVQSVEELEAMAEYRQDEILLLVQRGRATEYITLRE